MRRWDEAWCGGACNRYECGEGDRGLGLVALAGETEKGDETDGVWVCGLGCMIRRFLRVLVRGVSSIVDMPLTSTVWIM